MNLIEQLHQHGMDKSTDALDALAEAVRGDRKGSNRPMPSKLQREDSA